MKDLKFRLIDPTGNDDELLYNSWYDAVDDLYAILTDVFDSIAFEIGVNMRDTEDKYNFFYQHADDIARENGYRIDDVLIK